MANITFYHPKKKDEVLNYNPQNPQALSGKDLSYALLVNFSFDGFLLKDTNLFLSSVKGHSLKFIAGEPVVIPQSTFQGATFFETTDCRGVYFYDCDLEGAIDFEKAQLDGAHLYYAKNIPQRYLSVCREDMMRVLAPMNENQKKTFFENFVIPKGDQGLVEDMSKQNLLEMCAQATNTKPEQYLKDIKGGYVSGFHNHAEQMLFQLRKGSDLKNRTWSQENPFLVELFKLK
jgi:hypothetical protein